MSTESSLPIGEKNESSLHAALKAHYFTEGDDVETQINGYFIDLVHIDTLIEIQIGNFANIKPKLGHLLEFNKVHIVFPLVIKRWIIRQDGKNKTISRRQSPKQGRLEEIFSQLIYIPHYLTHPNFSLEICSIYEEQIWRDDSRGSWRRRGWSIADRRLLEILDQVQITFPGSYLEFIPTHLAERFTTREIADARGIRRYLASKLVYTLYKMDLLQRTGKRGRSIEYTVIQTT